MSIKLYDDAVSEKITKWVKDPNLRILKPDESTRFLEMKLDEYKDAPLRLPLISISRDKNIEIISTQKQPKTFDGYKLASGSDSTLLLNVIPIQLSYQIDIYTKGMIEADEYLRNFVFNLINYPKLEITIPYNDVNVKHQSNISLESTLTDNSDIKEHLFADQFVRFSIRFKIDDAYLFSVPVKENVKIEEFNLEVQNLRTGKIDESTKII